MTSARRREKKRVLFICGSMNQTTQMHRVASELPDYNCFFTPYYADGVIERLRRVGLMEFTIIGRQWRESCLAYLTEHRVAIDFAGARGPYDLVLTCQDLFIPANVRGAKGILVQEGMTDPEGLGYWLVKRFGFLPRYLASTAATGLSGWFERLCVASEGYAEQFAKKGVDPGKIVVTGIPNFDDCASYLKNDFPHRGHVVVCTSDARETFKIFHDRRAFLESAVRIARGRQLIFKLHPNEKVDRATREIKQLAPDALIYTSGCAEHMIANGEALVTEYSSTAFVGIALGKEVHSAFPIEQLRRLLPLQNRCAARNIAGVGRELLGDRATQASASTWAAPGWWADCAMMVP